MLNRPGGFRDPGEPEEYCRGFQVFDKELTGFIGVGQFRYILTNLGEKMSDDEVDELLKAVDTSSGELNYMGELRRDMLVNITRPANTDAFPQTWSRRSSQTRAHPFLSSRHDMNFHGYGVIILTGSTMGMGQDFETWEAASGALGVQASCAQPKLFSMHQSIEFRIVYIQHFKKAVFHWQYVLCGATLRRLGIIAQRLTGGSRAADMIIAVREHALVSR